jgi:hypothetical protein
MIAPTWKPSPLHENENTNYDFHCLQPQPKHEDSAAILRPPLALSSSRPVPSPPMEKWKATATLPPPLPTVSTSHSRIHSRVPLRAISRADARPSASPLLRPYNREHHPLLLSPQLFPHPSSLLRFLNVTVLSTTSCHNHFPPPAHIHHRACRFRPRWGPSHSPLPFPSVVTSSRRPEWPNGATPASSPRRPWSSPPWTRGRRGLQATDQVHRIFSSKIILNSS